MSFLVSAARNFVFCVLALSYPGELMAFQYINYNSDGTISGACDGGYPAFSGGKNGDGFLFVANNTVYNVDMYEAIRQACLPREDNGNVREFSEGTFYCLANEEGHKNAAQFKQSRAAFDLFKQTMGPTNEIRISRGESVSCNTMAKGRFTVLDEDLSGQVSWWLCADSSGTKFYAFE